jgi:hypothetical protein
VVASAAEEPGKGGEPPKGAKESNEAQVKQRYRESAEVKRFYALNRL